MLAERGNARLFYGRKNGKIETVISELLFAGVQ
jgi:hypothetical protein